MALTEYTLPSLSSMAGTFSFTVYADSTLSLTAPTKQTIIEVGDLRETAAITPDEIEIPNVDLVIRDDENNFWFTAMSGTERLQLKILLDEGGGNTFYFWGEIQPESCVWSEHYLGSSPVRTCRPSFVSLVRRLEKVSTENWITAAYENRVSTGQQGTLAVYTAIKLSNFLAVLMREAFITTNPDVQSGDAVMVIDQADLEFIDGGTWYNLNDVYLPVEYNAGDELNPDIRKVDYFDTNSGFYLPNKYQNALALLKIVCQNFAVVPRILFDLSSGRFKIELVQMGRAYAATLNFSGREKESTLFQSSDLVLNVGIGYYSAWDTGDEHNATHVWFTRLHLPDLFPGTGYYLFDTEFPLDVDRGILWDLTGVEEGARPCRSNGAYFIGVRCYRYSNGTTYNPTTNLKMQETLALYWFDRWAVGRFLSYSRKYGRITASDGSTESHKHVAPMKRTTIDGSNYFANKVTKRVGTSELEIEWIKE